MRSDRCLFLIKPDVMHRGLTVPVREAIAQAEFTVLAERSMQLTEELIRAYQPVLNAPSEFGEVWKAEVIAFQTSAPIILILVEREGAMAKAREVKVALRKRFSPGSDYHSRVIFNLLHSPASNDELENNLRVLAPDWLHYFRKGGN